jgi:hypothetical protein
VPRMKITMAATTTSQTSTLRPLLVRIALAAVVIFLCSVLSRAGGPKRVAGTSYFDPSTTGQPVVWPPGQLTYYTDQGDLSPILPASSADAFVANALNQWTSVSTAALSATKAGHLAEDVNGSNVTRNLDGTLSIPTDIQPSALTMPIAVVYDYDGAVTDAFLGSGAGNTSQCFFNASFGGADSYGLFATFQHALVVINGQCVQQTGQLTDVEYRLVRVLGGVLGLDWSQLNTNVITGTPAPTSDDFAGFPVMHYLDPGGCVPITLCYPNPYQLAVDDVAAVSRLYPVTAQNQSNYTGKQVFSTTTARIHGSVWFTDSSGRATQPMQGANVVARWIDPITGQASGRYAASSVSGFLFIGNAGNPVTGFDDPLGNAFSEFGSDDASLEGFFDLAGLPFPGGAASGRYQLSVESLDPMWATGVGPYAPYQVALSGVPAPIVVVVVPGSDVAQDLLMSGSTQPVVPWAVSETWSAPAPIPAGGDWVGSLSGYGNVGYFSLPAQTNRTLSIAVTAIDANGTASESKVQPVIGMWASGDPQGTPPPALTTSPFNSASFGLTRLDAQILTSTNFLIGIADLRGDGRPDFHYHAHVLYGDSVSPARLSVNGGAVTLRGTGFVGGLTVAAGSSSISPLTVSAGQMILALPAQADGTQSVTITDPASGAFSAMTNALTYGAAATDNLVLVSGLNPLTPVGIQATNPVRVRVVASDGITSVSGATVGWSTTNNATLSACGGASSCNTTSDEGGAASTWVTPGAIGVATITAALAPAVYSPPKSVSATLLGTESATDIGVTTPYLSIAQGATVAVLLTARVLSNGVPKTGVTVNFTVVAGSGNLSSSSAVTSSSGYATVTLALTNFALSVQVSACVAPTNNPCQAFYGTPVPSSLQNLQSVAGAAQVITLGTAFQPVIVRVTDSSLPPVAVFGANVTFQTMVLRPIGDAPAGGSGENHVGTPAMPIILSAIQNSVASDSIGLVSIVPSTGPFNGSLEVDVSATAGTTAVLQYVLQALPVVGGGSTPVNRIPVWSGRAPAPGRRPIREQLW